jgi:hypothetical protein
LLDEVLQFGVYFDHLCLIFIDVIVDLVQHLVLVGYLLLEVLVLILQIRYYTTNHVQVLILVFKHLFLLLQHLSVVEAPRRFVLPIFAPLFQKCLVIILRLGVFDPTGAFCSVYRSCTTTTTTAS